MASLESPADEAYVARGKTNLLGTLRTDQAARERVEVLDARRNRDDMVDDDEEQVQSSGAVTDVQKTSLCNVPAKSDLMSHALLVISDRGLQPTDFE